MFDLRKEYDTITKLRWLQVNELALNNPNDQELGAKIRELIKNTK